MARVTQSNNAMKFSDCEELLVKLLPYAPALIEGPPGVGKTALAASVAKRLGKGFWPLHLQMHGIEDLKFPIVDTKKMTMKWVCTLFPQEGEWLILLDEIDKTPMAMHNALLQLIREKRMGSYVLPEGCMIMAAGNRLQDRSGSQTYSSAFEMRFITKQELLVDPAPDGDWHQWAKAQDVHPLVRTYVKENPTDLLCMDYDNLEMERSNPRALGEHASDTLRSGIADRLLYQSLTGCLGTAVAARFAAYCKTVAVMPQRDYALANPTTVQIPTDPAVLFAFVTMMPDWCRKAEPHVYEAVIHIIRRIGQDRGREFSTEATVNLLRIFGGPGLFKLRGGGELLKEHTHAIAGKEAA